MKIINLLLSSVIILCLFISCEEEINVKGEFRQKFVLNSVLKDDSNFQTVNISRSFEVEGFDPYSNRDDQSVKGARVRMWIDNDVYEFRDSVIDRRDTSVYKFPVHFYYHPNMKIGLDEKIILEAIIPDGKILRAETQTPSSFEFLQTSTINIPPVSGDQLNFEWVPDDLNSDFLYTPRLYINFYKEDTLGNLTYHTKQIPLDYIDVSGTEKEYFSLPSFNNQLSIAMSSMDKSMENIYEGDLPKRNYKIASAVFEVVVYDRNLTGYYVASNFIDDYSIRIDVIDFSNIEGGLGVLGSYIAISKALYFNKKYITNFGYIPYNR